MYGIKPLEWRETGPGVCCARNAIGEWTAGDGWFNSTWCEIEAPVDGGLDASKRAAEADYEARIRFVVIDNPLVEQPVWRSDMENAPRDGSQILFCWSERPSKGIVCRHWDEIPYGHWRGQDVDDADRWMLAPIHPAGLAAFKET